MIDLNKYWEWLSTLRPEVRTIYLRHIDDLGEPLCENPFDQILLDLCKLNANVGFESFVADAEAALEKHLKRTDLRLCYVMFMGGAIWGTETMRDEMRKIFAEMPTSKNP